MEQEALRVEKNGIIKNAFNKNKKPININEVDITSIILSVKNHLVKTIYLNNFFYINIKVMFFQYCYV